MISAIGGMAGVGKTALALHWAHHVAGRFPGGQLYVNLRGFDPSATPVTAAEAIRGFLCALGIPPERVPPSHDAQASLYRSLLAERTMLVVLDNASDEQQVRPLLPASAGTLVQVTSRRQLVGLAGAKGADAVIVTGNEGEVVAHAMAAPDLLDGVFAANVAPVVADAWQNHGIGTALVTTMIRRASSDGMASVMEIDDDNNRMNALLSRHYPHAVRRRSDGAITAVVTSP